MAATTSQARISNNLKIPTTTYDYTLIALTLNITIQIKSTQQIQQSNTAPIRTRMHTVSAITIT